jgi:hypothetical protein
LSSFLSGVRNVIDFLEGHSGAIVSVATAVIAAFSVATVWATERLAKLTSASIKLARAEFIATHRPKIITRGFESASDVWSNQKAALRFTFVNIGNTPATIVSIGAVITECSEPGLSLPERLLDPPIRLAGGQHRPWLVEADGLASGTAGTFCIGCITYKDALGQTRQTGFCRELNPSNGRWIRQVNSEYEYAD